MSDSTHAAAKIFRSEPTRRAVAAALIVFCFGGLVLHRSGPRAKAAGHGGASSARFSGPGVHGRFSLSHGKIDVTADRPSLFAELRLVASSLEGPYTRAPLAMAVVVDTSGSMSGAKLVEAKRSVLQLIDTMQPDDQIALVRYSGDSQVLQPLARVGIVRDALRARVQAMVARGGTNIHAGLQRGLQTLSFAPETSARRVVLVSDGLDSTRSQTVAAANGGAESGCAVSALGIGLDFDEAYLAAVAQAGHGNFGFVQDPSSLAAFLSRELEETAATTVREVVARLQLPAGVRVQSVVGAHVEGSRGEIRLRVGSLRPGAERRIVLRLAVDSARAAARSSIASRLTWLTREGGLVEQNVGGVLFETTTDPSAMLDSRDAAVFASAVSAFASKDQLQAAEAYRRGDRAEAERLIERNLAALNEAEADAPADIKDGLSKQKRRYRSTKRSFGAAKPGSEAGRAAAKSAVQSDASNLGGVTF